MTITNRAFIKVYRHDPAESASPSRPPAALERSASSGVGACVEFVAAATGLGMQSAGAVKSVASVAGSIDVLPPSAAPFVDSTLSFTNSAAADEQRADSSPHRKPTLAIKLPSAGRHEPAKRPLSSYIARARAFDNLATSHEPTTLRPGTIVASFRWPEVCRALATQCRAELDAVVDQLVAQSAAGARSAGVIGLYRGQGCTSVLLALAARLAARERNILFIDGNFSNPQLAARLDVVPTCGWHEALQSDTPLADSLIRSADDRLDLLALGAGAVNITAPAASSALAKLNCEPLRRAYDLTLVDLGAFFDARSKPIGLQLVRRMAIDVAVAVTGPALADPRDLASLDAALGERGCQLSGTIENRASGRRADLN